MQEPGARCAAALHHSTTQAAGLSSGHPKVNWDGLLASKGALICARLAFCFVELKQSVVCCIIAAD